MSYPFSTYDTSKTYHTHIRNIHYICYTPKNITCLYLIFLKYDTHMTRVAEICPLYSSQTDICHFGSSPSLQIPALSWLPISNTTHP